jgi:hypothetical protein
MYIYSYDYPNGNLNIYQNPYNYPYRYSNMNPYPYNNPYGYSNLYQYPYSYPSQYQHAVNYYNRDPKFVEKIGQYYKLQKELVLPNGYKVPANTRIFIHNVFVTTTGEELVTIVAPVPKDGTMSNESFKDIPASQIN